MFRCFRDNDGDLRVDTQCAHQVLAAYFIEDVQGSEIFARELLKVIDDVQGGVVERWSGTGNAHALSISNAEVEIENLWDDSMEIAKLPLDEFRDCVEKWIVCIGKE